MLLVQVEEQREWTEMGVASSGDGSSDDEVDTLTLYKQIMELLKPGETLTKVCGGCVGVWVCGVCVGGGSVGGVFVCVRSECVCVCVCVEPLSNTL